MYKRQGLDTATVLLTAIIYVYVSHCVKHSLSRTDVITLNEKRMSEGDKLVKSVEDGAGIVRRIRLDIVQSISVDTHQSLQNKNLPAFDEVKFRVRSVTQHAEICRVRCKGR